MIQPGTDGGSDKGCPSWAVALASGEFADHVLDEADTPFSAALIIILMALTIASTIASCCGGTSSTAD